MMKAEVNASLKGQLPFDKIEGKISVEVISDVSQFNMWILIDLACYWLTNRQVLFREIAFSFQQVLLTNFL